MYYDKDGKSIGLEELSEKFEDKDYRKVGFYENTFIRVSTVWLGIDHRFGEGKPLIFETMVFGITMNDLYCERYSTLEDAKAGHIRITRLYKNKIHLSIWGYCKERFEYFLYKTKTFLRNLIAEINKNKKKLV